MASRRYRTAWTALVIRCIEKLARARVVLPERSRKGAYDDQKSLAGRRFVEERY